MPFSCIDLIAPEGTLAFAEDKNGTQHTAGHQHQRISDRACPWSAWSTAAPPARRSSLPASLRTLNGARLVGTTTQGKGTIQSSPQRLSDGSAVVVTVAKLVCGDGSCFDGTGLTVDVERPLTADEQTAYYDYTVENDPADPACCEHCPADERYHHRERCQRSGFQSRLPTVPPPRAVAEGDAEAASAESTPAETTPAESEAAGESTASSSQDIREQPSPSALTRCHLSRRARSWQFMQSLRFCQKLPLWGSWRAKRD